MKRREFITLIGGAAAWPLAAGGQQGRLRRVGALMGVAEDGEGTRRVNALRDGLRALGWSVGQNLHMDVRWGANGDRMAQIRASAAELVRLKPDVILANGGTTLGPLQEQ